MKIPAVTVPVSGTEKDAIGLLLAFFQASMVAHKRNSVAPIQHFFRERLTKKSERAKLNVMLNAMCNQLAKSNKAFTPRGSQVLDSAGGSNEVDPVVDMLGKIKTLEKRLQRLERWKAESTKGSVEADKAEKSAPASEDSPVKP